MEAGMSRLVQFDQLRNTRDLGGMVTMEGHRITEEHGFGSGPERSRKAG